MTTADNYYLQNQRATKLQLWTTLYPTNQAHRLELYIHPLGDPLVNHRRAKQQAQDPVSSTYAAKRH